MKKNNLTTQEVLTRGVFEVLPDKASLEALMQKKTIRVYLGIDPTGSLLTLGHSVVLRKLQQFAELGSEVILLIGNGTVRIGDPTGKDSTRPELTDEVIKENFKSWKDQASKILDFNKITIKYNGDWLDKLSFTDVIKLMAKTTVQQLMERDMFQKRVEEGKPIHGHEIMYPLLQGYDSVVMDVDLEIGGSDQTFNMLMGRHLQKIYNNKEKWVLSTPIINGTDGRKMSKSYGNFIAITEDHINMYGKLMSIADDMIIEYMTLLTDLPLEQISEYENRLKNGENPMAIKKILALEITTFYHDADKALEAQIHFENTVQNKQIPNDIPKILIEKNMTVLSVLQKCMPLKSNSDLRRLVDQMAVSNAKSGEKYSIATQIVNFQNGDIIKIGKREYFELEVK